MATKLSKSFINSLSFKDSVSEKADNELHRFFNKMQPWKFDQFIQIHIPSQEFAAVLQNYRPEENGVPGTLNWVADEVVFITKNLQSEQIQNCLTSLDYIQEVYK